MPGKLRTLSIEEKYDLVEDAFYIADGDFSAEQAERMIRVILEQTDEKSLVTWSGVGNSHGVFGSDRMNKLVALIALSRMGPNEIYSVVRQATGEEEWKGDKKNGFSSWRERLIELFTENKIIPKSECFPKVRNE